MGPFLWRPNLFWRLCGAFHVDGCALVAYMDDVLLIIWAPTRTLLEHRGNSALNIIVNLATCNTIDISKEKSKSLTFGKPKHLKRGPTYKIQMKKIKSEKKTYYT